MAKKLDSLKRGPATLGLLENGTLLQRWQPIRSQPSGVAQLCRDVIKPDLSPTERENTTVRHWHTICIKAVQNALTVDWDLDSSLQKVLNQLQVEPVARPVDAETGEDVFLNQAWAPPFREYRPNRPKRTSQVGWKDLFSFTRCTMMQKKPKRRQQCGWICWKGAWSPNLQPVRHPDCRIRRGGRRR